MTVDCVKAVEVTASSKTLEIKQLPTIRLGIKKLELTTQTMSIVDTARPIRVLETIALQEQSLVYGRQPLSVSVIESTLVGAVGVDCKQSGECSAGNRSIKYVWMLKYLQGMVTNRIAASVRLLSACALTRQLDTQTKVNRIHCSRIEDLRNDRDQLQTQVNAMQNNTDSHAPAIEKSSNPVVDMTVEDGSIYSYYESEQHGSQGEEFERLDAGELARIGRQIVEVELPMCRRIKLFGKVARLSRVCSNAIVKAYFSSLTTI